MAKKPDEQSIFDIQAATKPQGPVECLGMTFPDDNARRKHFLGILREKLNDPEFRKIEGFPIGTDEDILALSDPPYYTACPNPFIADFIQYYGKPYDPSTPYSREPFAADVSEGKYDPIYKYHPYPTKVPHRAIMRYILHFTEPGDIVFDGFCGTGMTGVAAQMCGDRAGVESLGYRVEKDGTILQKESEQRGTPVWAPFSKLGSRRAVLNDLSPAATFIAYNYNTPVDVHAFEQEANRILKQVEAECGWMYETLHTDGKTKGKINYTVWSDVFVCPECTRELIFWATAVDKQAGSVKEEFQCPHCMACLTKRQMHRVWVTNHDKAINQTIRQAKQVPVLINYSVAGRRAEKSPDVTDIALIEKIQNIDIPHWFPTDELPDGFNTRQPRASHGITHVHHFYSRRNLFVLASIKTLSTCTLLNALITKVSFQITKLYRFTYQSGVWGAGGGPLNGTLYIPSLVKELNIYNQIFDAMSSRRKLGSIVRNDCHLITTQSSTELPDIESNYVDYIFIDPPFGANINYSELCTLWEQWLAILTNNKSEAIENDVQGKGPNEYRYLMTACFNEAYRVLKPGRWMTVEFSNTKASVWNSIQTALTAAGFIVANVSALDKKKASFKAVTTPTAVKQDLVISAYKPNGGFEDRFQKSATTEEGVWDFVRTHLKYLPVVKRGASAKHLISVMERDPRILYDQMLQYFLRGDRPISLDSTAFQEGLSQRFPHSDGMCFLPEQVAEYERKKLSAGGMEQMSLFVSDESSAIAWLRQLLRNKPLSFQDINPLFIQALAAWRRHEKPLELSELLEQNFLRYNGKGDVPNQIHSYLSTNFREFRNLPKDDESLRAKGKDRWYVPDPNKAGDLEKLRERSLLKEFEQYRTSSQKRLKVFRIEAVRAGFKKARQERDFAVIISIASRLPEDVLQEDPKLLMWYDHAVNRTGEDR
jgi:DNA modification methylase